MLHDLTILWNGRNSWSTVTKQIHQNSNSVVGCEHWLYRIEISDSITKSLHVHPGRRYAWPRNVIDWSICSFANWDRQKTVMSPFWETELTDLRSRNMCSVFNCFLTLVRGELINCSREGIISHVFMSILISITSIKFLVYY